jgi:hypothetical protein
MPVLGIAAVAAFIGVLSPGLAGSWLASRFGCFGGIVGEAAFLRADALWPWLGDENGFLLTT